MRDSYTLRLKNFRSIREATVDIAPLTVIYGQNGSGKSSLIYGLLTLKNFLTNPQRNLPGLLTYPSLSLGTFNDVVFGHKEDEQILLSLMLTSYQDSESLEYELTMLNSGGRSILAFYNLDDINSSWHVEGEVFFPHGGGVIATGNPFEAKGDTGNRFQWDGISLTVSGPSQTVPAESDRHLLEKVNMPMELARKTRFVPLLRGFTRPVYGVANITPELQTDEEIASLLVTDQYLMYAVSDAVERVADRRINTHVRPGTSSFTLDSIPRTGGIPGSIVNDGFGINQLTWMLTVCLYNESSIVAIEEPEIHLHPSMIRRLVHEMVDIVSNHDKRIIVSTHSEHFVLALLAEIVRGKIGVNDVSFILAEKEDGKSKFTKNEAHPNGQLDGGIAPFIESEFEDINTFLGLEAETG